MPTDGVLCVNVSFKRVVVGMGMVGVPEPRSVVGFAIVRNSVIIISKCQKLEGFHEYRYVDVFIEGLFCILELPFGGLMNKSPISDVEYCSNVTSQLQDPLSLYRTFAYNNEKNIQI